MRVPGVLAFASILAGSVSVRAETTVEIRPQLESEPVAAKPATISIGFVDATVSLDRVKLELSVEPHAVVGKLVLAYSSPDRPKHVVVPVGVPAGTAIETLRVSTGLQDLRAPVRLPGGRVRPLGVGVAGPAGRPVSPPTPVWLVGKSLESVRARTLFDDVREIHRDPALVEWQGSEGGMDRVQLEVFPIGRGSPGVVELGLELPRMPQLVLDVDGQLVDRVDVVVVDRGKRATKRVEWVRAAMPIVLGEHVRPGMLAPRASNVSASHSLVAVPAGAPARRVPVVIICGVPHRDPVESPITKLAIRRVVRGAQPRLQHCFEKTLQSNPNLIGGMVNFHFTIAGGKATEIALDGELDHPEVRSCMQREVATWTFPSAPEGSRAASERVRVNYPMKFYSYAELFAEMDAHPQTDR